MKSTALTSSILIFLSGCSLFQSNQPAVDVYSTSDPRTKVMAFDFEGETRTILVDYPKKFSSDTSMILLFALHGGGGSADRFRGNTGLTELTDSLPLILAFPNGTGRFSNRLLTWNAGDCCGYANDNQINDIGFLAALTDSLQKRYAISPERTFMTGISNGGMMTYQFALHYPEKVKGIIPVAATMATGELKGKGAVSVLHIHGLDDNYVPYDGGFGSRNPSKQYRRPVEDGILYWARINKTNPVPVTSFFEGFDRSDYQSQTHPVILIRIEKAGHGWPGGGDFAPGEVRVIEPRANDLILEFIRRSDQ